jgi:tRNA pseudouridine38-40 synthase
MPRRIRVHVAYDGTDFHGWQVQPGLLTIQGTLENVISAIEGRSVHVTASGRTDAGVHALEQVAAFTLSNPIPVDNLRKAINRLLPPSIRILHVCEAAPEFHPRYHAIAKTYEYRIWRAESCPPWEWRYLHHHPYPLQEEAMTAAALVLEGEHDFSAFAAADERDELGLSKVRTIYSSRIERLGELLLYRVRGSGFLKHMVRNIVGTLLEAGKGNLTEQGLRQILESGDRGLAGPTAPAKGLFLISVEY